MAQDDDGNFFSRWSRRKVQVRQGSVPAEPPPPVVPQPAPPVVLPEPVPPALAQPAAGDAATQSAAPPPPPTMDDVAALTTASDFRRFVASDVDPKVRNAALKTLFTDPHFNVMDGLDTYIDDYNTPDPLPASWLRKMTQSGALGLFDDDPAAKARNDSTGPAPDDRSGDTLADVYRPAAPEPVDLAPPSPALPEDPIPHEDADLRLQPHDAAGRLRADPGAGQDPGRQH